MDPKNLSLPAILKIDTTCTGCGRCVAACPAHALSLVTEQINGFGRKTAKVNLMRCSDCGGCLSACPHNSLHIIRT